jgi:enediyne biosynthesis protein E3
MSLSRSRLRRAVMGVSDEKATAFATGDDATWRHLKTAVRAAVGGYHAVLDGHRPHDLIPRLDRVPLDLRGYAYEGAAMGLTAIDCFLPGRSRFTAYLNGPGQSHLYMAYIGAGQALARLRRRPEPFLRRLPDPALRWLVLDGYGFHEGFFRPGRFVRDHQVPTRLSAFGRRVFDQGVGRSVWFTAGARVDDVARVIRAFPAHRHADLWLGAGVACGYVGGVDRATITALRSAAGRHATRLAIGAAFVAKGRLRAGNPVPDTELACQLLCGVPAGKAAELVDQAFEDLPDTPSVPAYDCLQRRLAYRLADTTARLSGGERP